MPSVIPLVTDSDNIGHVEWAGFLGNNAVFASVEGAVHLLADRQQVINMHDGLLAACLAQDGSALITAGEDGKVEKLSKDGNTSLVYDANGKWIDRLASGPNGAVACSWGKNGAVILEQSGVPSEVKPFECERSIEGIAFQPKGMRIALARFNGVDLKWVNTNNPSQFLKWDGAHTGVVYSPDGKYVVSTMQENALHGWRLSDDKHMRMTGYPAKIKSISWSNKGKWLASSGAPAAIVWPFAGKDGPMGKAPKELGSMGQIMVTHVACHPSEDVVAIGYANGQILVVRIDDGKEAVLRREGKGAISTLGWDATGHRIAFGSESGEAGIVDISA
ncbi:MAG: WD40 repeat domain-containing protein [Nitratireductor sp.]